MNTFHDYWRSLAASQKRELAERADTSVNHLCQLASGHRRAGASLMHRLTTADENITRRMLRPDLYKASEEAAQHCAQY